LNQRSWQACYHSASSSSGMLPQLAPQSIPTASPSHSVLANQCSASTATCKTLVSAQAIVASTCIKPLTSGQQCNNDAAVPTSLHTNTPTLAPRAVSYAHLATHAHTSMHEKHTMSTSSAYCAPCAHWPCCSLCPHQLCYIDNLRTIPAACAHTLCTRNTQ
jgi:hypothetical protein